MDLGGEVPELVRRHMHAKMSADRRLDRPADTRQRSRRALGRNEESFWRFTDDAGCELVTIPMKTIRERNRQLKLQRLLVLGFLACDHDQGGSASPSRPVQVFTEFQRR